MPAPTPRHSMQSLVDSDRGVVSRDIFVSDDIYHSILKFF